MPERLAYIKGETKTDDCPFCAIPTMSDEDGLIVHRGASVYVVLNLYPVQLRPPDGGAVPPRRRLHGPDRGGDRRGRRADPDLDGACCARRAGRRASTSA